MRIHSARRHTFRSPFFDPRRRRYSIFQFSISAAPVYSLRSRSHKRSATVVRKMQLLYIYTLCRASYSESERAFHIFLRDIFSLSHLPRKMTFRRTSHVPRLLLRSICAGDLSVVQDICLLCTSAEKLGIITSENAIVDEPFCRDIKKLVCTIFECSIFRTAKRRPRPAQRAAKSKVSL